jgi:hypothetical protein
LQFKTPIHDDIPYRRAERVPLAHHPSTAFPVAMRGELVIGSARSDRIAAKHFAVDLPD